tara:strand:+ start:334 stop:576 length:243 start_codon:yes stop_codon:yes gene_type:complete
MDIKTYMKRAYASKDMDRANYHESNALHHLIGQLMYLSDTAGMKGNQLNKYGREVIERLQAIVKDYETGKNEGINTKGGE